jgi:hypothetical protein
MVDTPNDPIIIDPNRADAVREKPAPIIIDVGSRSKKEIRRLKEGRSRLLSEVELAVEQVRSDMKITDSNKEIIPVFILCRRKKKSRRKGVSLPFIPSSFF